jgi:hypothetical protein
MELVRQVIESARPDLAIVVECPSRAELQTFRCGVLVTAGKSVITRANGLRLYVYRKPQQLCLENV